MTGTFGSLGRLIVVSAALLLNSAAWAEDRNPIGEKANYVVDKNKKRTSSMIRSGTFVANVVEQTTDDGGNIFFKTHLDYRFIIALIGVQTGRQKMAIDKEFFSEAFLERMRRDQYFESPKFKVQHLGFADTTTLNGTFYPNCDKMLFYDIQQEGKAFFAGLLAGTLNMGPEFKQPTEEIENLKILAHIKYGVPVLGAVKLDVTGDYQGSFVKSGADYQPPE